MEDLTNTIRELFNIYRQSPLWPGDTISHDTANNCVELGWAARNKDGYFTPTTEGTMVFNLLNNAGVERFFK